MIKTEHLIIIGLLVFSTVILVVMYVRTRPGWSCSEKGCEQVIGGTYKSKSECDIACGKKLSAAKQQPTMDKWECKNYQCVPSASGYNTPEDCAANCSLPLMTTFTPVMSDWNILWGPRWRAGPWARYYTRVSGGKGWIHR